MATTGSSDHSVIYRGLQLHLAMTNDLSLAIGSSRTVDPVDSAVVDPVHGPLTYSMDLSLEKIIL
jgi:hypothetical protein